MAASLIRRCLKCPCITLDLGSKFKIAQSARNAVIETSLTILFRNFADSYGLPKLSPQEVTAILRTNEASTDLDSGSVRAFDTNQLPSNNPIEDRLSVVHCKLTTGALFGVFDGHGGPTCAEVVSQRLPDYIALAFLPQPLISEYLNSKESPCLVESYVETEGLSEAQQKLHKQALKLFAKDLLNRKDTPADFFMQHAMTNAFTRLDHDISAEVQEGIQHGDMDALALAVMGTCACVAHVEGAHLHIATSGDCKAVLGVLNEDNSWVAKPLTQEHNTDNVEELKRVMAEHPTSEQNVVIKNDRLLGQLAPLRAFGDFGYKWKMSVLKKLLVPFLGPGVIPPNYYTPPYLTARPEVIYHHLTPRDKFLVIASDGLWEQLLPHKVVKFVGQHMTGKQTLDLLRLPRRNMLLKDINSMLLQRKEGLARKPVDKNAATHLIRNALGRTEYGILHSKLASMLSIPDEMVRNFRDDISVVVIFFNSDFLRETPAS